MKNIIKYALCAALAAGSFNANASLSDGRLYIIGEALSYGYSLDAAQALLATSENPEVFTGTIYLKGNESFKFMENAEWGGTEYGASTSEPVSGQIILASGKNDSGYNKITVADAGNYYMVIDTKNLTATIEKSAYQAAPIEYCSLFLVGGNTPGGWSVDNGTPLYQSVETPYTYSNKDAYITSDGSFKIARTIKGGGTFDAKYWFYRDANDSGKISTDNTNDLQWSVAGDGNYAVSVNTVDNSISINKVVDETTGITTIITDASNDGNATYFNLQGVKVEHPASGIYIKVTNNSISKVRL